MSSGVFPFFNVFGDVEMLPSLETFGAQETNDDGIPSLSGDIGHFQCEGDMTLPLLEGRLLVLEEGQWNVGGWKMSCPAIVL